MRRILTTSVSLAALLLATTLACGQGAMILSGDAPPASYASYTGQDIIQPPATPNIGGLTNNGAQPTDTSYPSGTPATLIRCTDANSNPGTANISFSAGLGGSGDGVLFDTSDSLIHVNGNAGYITLMDPTTGVCHSTVITQDLAVPPTGTSSQPTAFSAGGFSILNPGVWIGLNGDFTISKYVINTSTGSYVTSTLADLKKGIPANSGTANAPPWQPNTTYPFGAYVSATPAGLATWQGGASNFILGDIISPVTGCALKLYKTGTTSPVPGPNWTTVCASTFGTQSDGTAVWRRIGPPTFVFQNTTGSGPGSGGGGTGSGGTPPSWLNGAGTPHMPGGHPDIMSTVQDSVLTWTNVGVDIVPNASNWRSFGGSGINDQFIAAALSTDSYGPTAVGLQNSVTTTESGNTVTATSPVNYVSSYTVGSEVELNNCIPGGYNVIGVILTGGAGTKTLTFTDVASGLGPGSGCSINSLNNYNNTNADQGTGIFVVEADLNAGNYHLVNTGTGIVSDNDGSGNWTTLGLVTGTACRFYIHNVKGPYGDREVIARQSIINATTCPDVEIVWRPTQTPFVAATQLLNNFNGNHWAMQKDHVVDVGSGGYGATLGVYAVQNSLSNPLALAPAVLVAHPCTPAGSATYPTPNCFAPAAVDSHLSCAFNPYWTDNSPCAGTMFNITTLSPVPVQPWDGEEVAVSTTPAAVSPGSLSIGTMWRFNHTFVTGSNPSFDAQFGISQFSQSGKYLAFTSDWMGTLGSTTGVAPTVGNGKLAVNPPIGKTFACLGAPVWLKSVTYTTGDLVGPVPTNTNGSATPFSVFQATTGGMTGTTAPNWGSVPNVGQTIGDGGVTWNSRGPGDCRSEVIIAKLPFANGASASGLATVDAFNGLVTKDNGAGAPLGTGGPNPQAANCFQGSSGGTVASTTATCTVVDATKYKIGEPMGFTGSGTAMDWSPAVAAANRTQAQAGGWKITNIVGNTLTLSSPVSQAITSHAGTIKPMRAYVATVNGRRTIVTPLDTTIFMQQVVQASDPVIAKYGSNACNTAKDEVIAWQLGNGSGLGFNSTGQSNSDDNYYGTTCSGFNQIPYQFETFMSNYLANRLAQGAFNGGPQAGKDMNWATDNNYTCQGIRRASMDYLDPLWPAFTTGWLGNANGMSTFWASPYTFGFDGQDSGNGADAPTNAGWQWNTLPLAKNDCHQAMLVLATSPHQSGNANVLYSGSNAPYMYPDPKVYLKTSSVYNPYGTSTTSTIPANCDYTVPSKICSMRDYLFLKYGTIGALNTAWGTSYTTFDSSETVVTGEVIGSGDGFITNFTHTFSHGNISPTSMQILVGGVQKGFDCPGGFTSCGGSGGTAQFKGQGTGRVSSGTCVYSTGVTCSITFATAPPTGANNITANFTWGGWGSSTPGTGLVDEDGTHLGGNGVAPFLPPAFANNHAYNLRDLIQDGTRSWQYVTAAGTSQNAGTPSFSATPGVPTSSGGATFISVGPPVAGPGGSFTGSEPNATMGQDLEDYLTYVAAAYYSGLRTGQKAAAPDQLNWGADQMGVWEAPPNAGVLKAANVYIDVAMTSLWDPSLDGAGPAKVDYFTNLAPNLPIINYQSAVTNQSAFSPGVNQPNFATQQLRGQWWYTFTNWWLNIVGADGLKHGAGLQWTSNVDGLQSASFGFETAATNPYNGHDDVTGVVSCAYNAFTCGSEASASWNATDGITHAGCGLCIQDATKLWTH